MALTEPTLADPIRPEDAWQQAATRETPFGQYLGEKLLGGLEAMRPVAALEMAMLPPRSGVPDEYGLVAPPGPSPVLDKTAWEASPHFRPGIEYDTGMTEARAEALATQHDRLAWNQSLVERYQGGFMGEAAGFVAGLAPGIADPTNYVPLLGPAAKAAMVARLGVIGGNVALHGAEAAANSALFEPLTAEHARTFGQPFGWEDAAADIALGALAGAAGGAIHGGLEYRGSLREAATRTRVDGLMRAADATNLALEQIDRGEAVNVAPVLEGRLPEAPRELPPGRVVQPAGQAEDVAVTAGGQRVPVRYELAEARDLIASHTADMGVNPDYPAALQPRDRTRAASQAQVQQMAANLEPALLGRSPTAEAGAPIVGPDGVVESGNARVLALGRAYADKMPGAAAYRDFLARQGLSTEGMDAPVLVRRRTSDMAPQERAAFARAANVSGVAAMGTAERARSDARTLKVDDLLQVQSSDMHAAANRPFVRAFMGRLPESERGGMLTASGELSKGGADRLRAALLAKAFGDPDLVARIAEEPEHRLGGLGRALAEIAPKWAAMRVEIAVGHIAPEGEGTGALLEALRSIVHSREAGEALHGPLKQGDMLGGGLSRDGKAFLRAFLSIDDEGGSKLASGKRLAEVLERYVEEARKQSPGVDMFGTPPATPAELLEGRREPPSHATPAPEIGPTGHEFTKPITDAAGRTIGRIEGAVDPEVFQVQHAEINEAKGQGHAVRAYAELADHVLATGRRLVSDGDLSSDAAHVYEALGRRGYTVERSPSAELVEEGGHSTWRTDDGGPVFTVTAGPKGLRPPSFATATPEEPPGLPGAALPADLDMSRGARASRAREQGYNVDYPLYHGSSADIEAFRPSERGAIGPGVYTTPQSIVAERYGDAVYPVYTRGKIFNASGSAARGLNDFYVSSAIPEGAVNKLFEGVPHDKVHPKIFTDLKEYGDASGDAVWRSLRSAIGDAEAHQRIKELGYRHILSNEDGLEVVSFDPADIRSVHAAYAPDEQPTAHILGYRRVEPSFATATPEPPHPSVAEAAPRVGKAEADPLATFKQDAQLEGYEQPLPGHEPKPEPGTPEAERAAKPQPEPTPQEKAAATAALPPELAEIEAMRREGSFRPEDEATLAAGEAEATKAEQYATAYETLVGCVLRNVA